MVSVGDLAQSFMLKRQTASLKTEIQRLSTEVVTGKVADVGRKVSGDFSTLAAIDSTSARLRAFGTVIRETTILAAATQAVLGTLDTLASDLTPGLLTAAASGQQAGIDAIASDARNRLEGAMAALNTRIGDRALFAGSQTGGTAVISGDALLDALQTVVFGAVTAQDVNQRLQTWFDDPTGFSAAAYLGGPPLSQVPIGIGESVAPGITATETAVRQTLRGLAMTALLERGVLAGNLMEQRALTVAAAQSLLGSQPDRSGLSARLGAAEARLDEASIRNETEATSLEMARNAAIGVDDYRTASDLEAAQTQLELLYSITARLTRLSLVDFLR